MERALISAGVLPKERMLRIGSVVIDCADFDRMLRFWQEALHYVPREQANDGWVVLRDPEGNLFCVVEKKR